MPAKDIELRTSRLLLRWLRPSDVDRVTEILNQPLVGRMVRQIPLPYAWEQSLEWLKTHEMERRSRIAFRFGVLHNDTLIGCVDVDNISDGLGELGYWFHPDWWGQGYALEAALAVVRFAFEHLELERLRASHAFDNDRSAKLHFHEVGRRMVWSHARQEKHPADLSRNGTDRVAERGQTVIGQKRRCSVRLLASWRLVWAIFTYLCREAVIGIYRRA